MMAFFSSTVLVVAVVAFVAAVLLIVRTRLPRRAGRTGLEPTLVAVQSGLAVGLLAALGTGAVVMAIDGAHQDWMGLPLALAPGLAASVGLLVVALTPPLRARAGSTRSAGLHRRGTWTIGSRDAYLRPAAAALVLVAVLLVTGLTAGLDEAGLSRALTVQNGDGSSSATPYPGWYYAGPLLAVTALLLIAAVLAMRRIATLPATQTADEEGDRAWRRAATSAISFLATAGLLAYLAAVLLITGSAVHSVSVELGPAALGWALLVIALLTGVLASACFGLAVARVATFTAAVRGPEPLPR